MKHLSTLFCALVVGLAGLGAAADAPRPVKIDREQLAGRIFDDGRSVVKEERSERGPFKTEDVEVFRSRDEHFDAGVYRSGPNRVTIDEPYGVDEFMYFLEGGVTLTSRDGSAIEVKAGEAVVIPKEWTGVWETGGYTKIYVIYSPGRPID